MSDLHLDAVTLIAGLPGVKESPEAEGTLRLIVRRPATEARETLDAGRLRVDEGLEGDNWQARYRDKGREANPEAELTLMNARLVQLLAGSEDRWALAGDQLYVDLDLSQDNLPVGSRLQIGEAVVEITPKAHTGCKKFVQRYGMDAMLFVNSEDGKALRLRGVYARTVKGGAIRAGDRVAKVDTPT